MENYGAHQNDGGPDQAQLSGRAAFFDAELWETINWFQRRLEKTRMLAFQLRFSATILSAATTVLLGLQSGVFASHKPVVLDIALTVSSLVTVLAAIESFFDFRGLWVRYTEARVRLVWLQRRLRFLASGDETIDDKILEGLFESYEKILAECHDAWLQMRRQTSRKEGNPHGEAK